MSVDRAGGAAVVSPALQRGESGSNKCTPESRGDGARTSLLQESIAVGCSLSAFGVRRSDPQRLIEDLRAFPLEIGVDRLPIY